MSNAAESSGAPVTVHGLELYPLGIPQYGRFENWMKQQAVDQGRDSIRGQGLSQIEMETVMSAAYDSRKDLTFGSPVGARHLNSIEGMTCLILLSCQKGNPDIDVEDIEDSLSNVSVAEVQDIVNTILRISNLTKKPDGGLKQKKSPRKKKRTQRR